MFKFSFLATANISVRVNAYFVRKPLKTNHPYIECHSTMFWCNFGLYSASKFLLFFKTVSIMPRVSLIY